MKKCIRKFALTAFAAILAPLGVFAVGDTGDVVSIQAVPLNGNWETPKEVGETFSSASSTRTGRSPLTRRIRRRTSG